LWLRWDEVMQLIRSTKKLRDRLIIRLLAYTGIRSKELRYLRIEDIDPHRRAIFIARGKGGRSRLVYVDAETLTLLATYIGARRKGWVFPGRKGKPLSKQGVWYIVKQAALRAGVRYAEKVSPHKLRHSFAIRWLTCHGDIESLRRLLGHRTLISTQIYLDFADERVREEYDRIYSAPK